MESEGIMECLSYFGKDPLSDDAAKYIWNETVVMHGMVEEIPDSVLTQLEWVLHVVDLDDLANITLNEVETITALGKYHNLSESQLQVLAENVLEDWADKTSSDYTNFDLTALQHILCGFNRTTIEAIHPDSYKDAASSLSMLRGCSQESLEALLVLAMAADAFGEPSGWSLSQVRNVGCILNGMSATTISTIPPVGFESANPEIITCLLPDTLKKMSAAQLSHLSPSAVGVMTAQQKYILSKEQTRAITEAYQGLEIKRNGSNDQQPLVGLVTELLMLLGLCFIIEI